MCYAHAHLIVQSCVYTCTHIHVYIVYRLVENTGAIKSGESLCVYEIIVPLLVVKVYSR